MKLRMRPHEEPEMNLINLVDIFLLLLVFFMISTTFLDEARIKIRLPQAGAEPNVNQQRDVIEVTVNRGRQLSRERSGAHQFLIGDIEHGHY